jgi:polyisoprenyl-teichoic acid--peptidoglycan teichoic acid transferase
VTLISIPRDIWYQPAQAKINTLYYYGQQKGIETELVKQGVFDILGQTADHWLMIDFSTFEKMINWLGGINIYIDQAFDDYKYPTAGKEDDLCNGDKTYACRYEKVHFEKGEQYLDGAMALKFVRSRNAVGEEGTDTARSKRQEKVIAAIKSKLLSPKTLLNFQKIQGGLQIIQTGIKTNVNRNEILPLAKLILVASRKEMKSYVLDGWETDTGLLVHPLTHPSKQWVLLPRGNSWDQVHQFVNCFLEKRDIPLCPQTGK